MLGVTLYLEPVIVIGFLFPIQNPLLCLCNYHRYTSFFSLTHTCTLLRDSH